ncbi:MAG: S1 family peptidase [Chloroflexota bacterium]
MLRFKGNAPLPPSIAALLRENDGVSVEMGASNTLVELLAGQARIAQEVHANYPDMGIEIDVRTGSVGLIGPYELGSEELSNLTALAGVAMIAQVAPPARPEHTYGGKNINIGAYLCTTGFTVKDAVSGLTGVLTAGHCAVTNTGTYRQNTSISYQVTLGGVRWDANQDFSWWQNASHTVLPQFWDGTSLRQQTSVKSLNSMVGSPVCHFGAWTGYSCGLTTSVNYDPGPTYCNGGPCTPVWVRVEDLSGYNIKCHGGDSGGPYFFASAAWGIHSGGAHTGAGGEDCVFTVMFSAEGLTWDGVNTRILLP